MDSAVYIYLLMSIYVVITIQEKETMKLRGNEAAQEDLEGQSKRRLEGGKGVGKMM